MLLDDFALLLSALKKSISR